MSPESLWWLAPVFFLIALLYASVGHGGASGYLAVLSFLAARPDAMATTALTLNLVVAGIALASFARAGHLDGRLAWPFIAASVPAAFLGGAVPVPLHLYNILLAVALGVAAIRLAVTLRGRDESSGVIPPPGRGLPSAIPAPSGPAYGWLTGGGMKPTLALALPVGGGIGWLSGAVGVGGGIFLSPLLLLLRWANPKQTAAASAAFILVNSAAGLGGRAVRAGLEYGTLWPLLAAALIGGWVGASLGAHHFSGQTLKRLLALVLLIAAVRLLISQGV